jgi:hypothetical protein
MESVDAKMIRAHEHLEAFSQEAHDYLSALEITMVLKTAPANPFPWLVIWANDYIPPMRLSVLLGDCVHNMRAALDNLVCGLARTADPRCTCKGAFPFRQSETDWNKHFQNDLAGVPPAAQSIIKALQPWHNLTSPRIMLNRLSNTDKHRACNLALAYDRNAGFRVHGNDGTITEVACKEPLYLGDVHTIVLPIPRSTVEPSARVEAGGTFTVSIREEGNWGDTPVAQVLECCFDHIEKAVIAKLRPFFEQQ